MECQSLIKSMQVKKKELIELIRRGEAHSGISPPFIFSHLSHLFPGHFIVSLPLRHTHARYPSHSRSDLASVVPQPPLSASLLLTFRSLACPCIYFPSFPPSLLLCLLLFLLLLLRSPLTLSPRPPPLLLTRSGSILSPLHLYLRAHLSPLLSPPSFLAVTY